MSTTRLLLNLPDLIKQPTLLDLIILLFIEVYDNDWNEKWSYEEVKNLFLNPPHDSNDGWVCVIRNQEAIMGFSYVGIINPELVREVPKEYSPAETQSTLTEVSSILTQETGKAPVVHFKELVLGKPFRGGGLSKLRQLIEPTLTQGRSQGARHVVMRTAAGTTMHRLALGLLAFQPVFSYPHTSQVLMVSNIDTILSNLVSPPSS